MSSSLDESIIVVSGLPRSGTSMMMQMLKSGGLDVLTDDARQADEDNPRGYFEFEPVKRTKKDGSWLAGASGKAVKMVHALLHDLPTNRSYRVILMRRNIEETLASQTAMLSRSGKEGAALAPERLAKMFEQQLQKVWAYLDEQECFEAIEVWYDAVLTDSSKQATAINDFLDGALDVEAMAAAVDPALYRNKR